MNPERYQQVKDLFLRALALPPPVRGAFLDETCAGDRELRRDVADLLAADAAAEAEAFIDRPAAGALVVAPAAPPASEAPLTRRIGRYALEAEIGRGGMGSVWRAVAEDDAERRPVAIKLVKVGLLGQDVIARFRREERILAALDHPNIARLLDAGVTDAGLPFLVIELIDGQAIDDHARRERLSLRERVRLFLDVCAAVHYAHGRQVIHRDLKPTNILVDRGGAAKLLDFGIAKLLETADPLAASTVTMHGQMTPEYASPEQIRGRALTPATDVFSLGIVLCELLSGARPFASVSRQPEELVRAVLEGRPQLPSALVRRSAADAAQSAELEAELRRGLDAVVLQALRPEPADRYPSVAALAADLERWLQGEAVRARPEPLSLRARRLLRGRRTAVLGVAGLTLALVAAGVALPAWRARRERDLREAAQRELLESRRRAGLVLAGVDESLASLPHEAAARALVLHAAARDLEQLEDRRAPEDPALARRLAVAWERVAELQPPGAASLEARRGAAARAEALARSLVEADPRDADARRLLARLRERRAVIEADAARSPAARRTPAEPPP